MLAYGADETSLTLEQQTQCAEIIAAGKAILIERNTINSACAIADIGQELQRVSIIQTINVETNVSQVNENKLPELPESVLAQIAAYATDLQRPNSLTQDQITRCAAVGTESLKATDIELFFIKKIKKEFVSKTPGDTINNILNERQNSNNGQVQRLLNLDFKHFVEEGLQASRV